MGEGKHVNYCSIYSHLSCQSLECSAASSAQRRCLSVVNCTDWRTEISLSHPFTRPWPSPFLAASCTIRNTKLTQKRVRTRSSIQLKRTWQFEESDNPWSVANISRWERWGLPADPAWAHIHNRVRDRSLSLSLLLTLCVLCGWPKDQTGWLTSSWDDASQAMGEPLRVSPLSSAPFCCIELTRSFNPAHVKLLSGSPSRFYSPPPFPFLFLWVGIPCL